MGKYFINVPAMPDIVDFNDSRIFIDPIYDPVALGLERHVPRQLALEPLPDVRFVSQGLYGPLDERLQWRRQPENLTPANCRIYETEGSRHGSAQASSWLMTLPASNSFEDRAKALTMRLSARISMVSSRDS
jgi:hypothetical protein